MVNGHLMVLGLRNQDKGVPTLLSLGLQVPQSPPWLPAGQEGGAGERELGSTGPALRCMEPAGPARELPWDTTSEPKAGALRPCPQKSEAEVSLGVPVLCP